MSLLVTLRNDLTAAMKAKDVVKKDTLRLLLSEVNLAKKSNPDLGDDDVIVLITKAVKRRDEAIEAATRASRSDISDRESLEKAVLVEYLPKQLEHWEVDIIVTEAIIDSHATSKKDMGRVMKLLVPKIKGKFDAKVVKDMVLNRLP